MPEQNSRQAELTALADLLTPMAIRVAATLRLADQLAPGPATATALAEACGCDADALERLLLHLVRKGVFSRDTAGRFGITDLGDVLRDGHAAGLRRQLDIDGALGRADLALAQLLHSVRTGGAAFPEQFGRGFWEYVSADPRLTASFDAQMAADVAHWAEAIVPAYDWGALGDVIDVGGGNGTLLAALLRTYPGLRGTVFDQPATVAAAERLLAAGGLSDRAGAIAGDFFQSVPAGARGYLLTAILHDWSDGEAIQILRRCGEASGSLGRVFLIEKTGAGGEAVSSSMDLRLLAYCGGRERGVGALSALAASAGLRVLGVYPAGDLSILELRA